MNFTKEQSEAIYARNADILVSAAAGSGKTAVLVERIIKLITDTEVDVNIDNLLIVTFTEAAGKEMRHRLEARLNAMLEETPNDENLRRQLVLLNRAYISTIHSFCKKIISQNFTMLEIDTTFRLADNLEKNLIEEEVLDEVLEGYYSKEDNHIFRHLLEMYSEKIEDENFRQVVYKIYKNSLNHTEPIKWLSSAVEIHKVSTLSGSYVESETLGLVKQYLEKCIASLEQGKVLVAKETDLAKVWTFISDELNFYLNFYSKIKDGTYNEIYSFYNSNSKLASYPKISVSKLEPLVADIATKVKALRDTAKKYFDKIGEILFDDEETIIQNLNFLAPYVEELSNIVIEFSEKLLSEKYARNLLTFSDLEHLAIKVLVESFNDGTPVYSEAARKYQERFYEIVIDEYQDTNEVQDLILTAISRAALNKPNKFMVGDVKQSIYKFRGGDPKLFISKYNSYTYDKDSHYQKIDLSKNFRSSKSVIQLVNFVFLQLMQPTVGGINYDENAMLHYGRETDEEAKTEILICDFQSKENELKNPFKSKEELEFEVIAKRVIELVENKEKVVKYSDIAILLRSRGNIDELVRILKKYNIPTTSKTVGDFYDNYEIQLILSYLQILDNPLNDLPLLAVLKSPIYNISDDELVEIATIEGGVHFIKKVENIIEKSENRALVEKLAMFKSDYDYFKEIDKEMSISEFILNMYEKTEVLAIFKAFKNGDSMVLNLMYLIEKAVDFEKTSFTTVFNFVKYIEKVKTSEGDDNVKTVDNTNSVRIMTIHESKGLEFPVVFVSNLDKQFNFRDAQSNIIATYDIPFTSKVLDPKTRVISNTLLRSVMANTLKNEVIAEELRIFYVALTRAREQLILTSYVSDLKSAKKDWSDRFNSDSTELFAGDVLSCKSYLDFLMKPIFAHESSKDLHDEEKMIAGLYDFDLPIKIDIIKASKFTKLEVASAQSNSEITEKFDIDLSNKVYDYEIFTTLPTFTTISEIKRKFNAVEKGEFNEHIDKFNRAKTLTKTEPRFIKKEEISATKKGTVIHKVYEKIDFKKVVTLESVENCVKDLLLSNKITDEEYNVIDIQKVYNFFELDLFERIFKSKNIYKEQIFTLGLPFKEVYPDITESGVDIDKNIIVKGMIDCFFEEEDGCVLIDFKTDLVTEDTIDTVAELYRIQLELYARAIKQGFGKDVTEIYLYFYSVNRLYKLEY